MNASGRLNRVVRFSFSIGVGVVAWHGVAGIHEAHAEDERHECAAAAYDGQRLRDEGKLTEARAKFLQCGAPRCPSVVATDCAKWVSEVDTRLPTIALSVKDKEGHDLEHVRVAIDGVVVTEQLDGRSIPVDPGKHTVRFQAEGLLPAEETLMVVEGQKGRTVSVVLGGASRPAASSTSSGSSTPLWPAVVAGGIGVVGVGAFAILGATGQSEKNHLSDTCAPLGTCDPSDVRAARTKLLVADVSLGVGVVSLGVATYFLVRHLNSPSTTTAQAPRIGLDVATMHDGAACTLRGSF